MKLEDQVCSLELAKKLKELGVKQESLFGWFYIDGPTIYNGPEVWYRNAEIPSEGIMECAALTVAELGEMLRSALKHLGNKVVVNIPQKRVRQLFTRVMNGISENEAEDRSKMLIYLIENELVDKSICEKTMKE